MKIVLIKNNSFVVTFFLLLIISCKISTSKGVDNSIVKDTVIKKNDYSNIEVMSYFEKIDSINNGFNSELINTFPVKKGDTVLFRKWLTADSKLVEIQNSKFRIQNSKYANYYKTGKNRFSRCKILLKNNSNDVIFSFYSYVDYGNINDIDSDADPYDSYNSRSSCKLVKINESTVRFDFSRINIGEFYMNFQIKNKEIHITKIVENPSFFNQNHYELDTLIVINNKNNIINVGKLYDTTHNKRNRKK